MTNRNPGSSYHLTFEPGLARVALWGTVTMPIVIAAGEQLYSAPDWVPGCPELWDFSGIDSLIATPEGLQAVVDSEVRLGAIIGPGRTAIVAVREGDHDLGVLYSHLPKHSGREHRTFWTEEEARAWLSGS